jgi:hypothetical protein
VAGIQLYLQLRLLVAVVVAITIQTQVELVVDQAAVAVLQTVAQVQVVQAIHHQFFHRKEIMVEQECQVPQHGLVVEVVALAQLAIMLDQTLVEQVE